MPLPPLLYFFGGVFILRGIILIMMSGEALKILWAWTSNRSTEALRALFVHLRSVPDAKQEEILRGMREGGFTEAELEDAEIVLGAAGGGE